MGQAAKDAISYDPRMRITLDLSELVDLPRRVTTVLEAAGRTRMLQELSATTLRQHQQRFSQRRSPDGSPWTPRKDSKPHPILEETGRMRRSIRAVPDGDGVAVTAEPPYAPVHQYGSERVPARPFLGWGEDDLQSLADTSAEWITGWWGEAMR